MGKKITAGTNFDPEKVKGFVDRVETLKASGQALKDGIKPELESVAEDIAEVMKEAEGAGIDPKLLKTAIKQRKAERDAEALREKFVGPKQDAYDALMLALNEIKEAA